MSFLCCERSLRDSAAMPVGRWVYRTPDSVLFWCWPPGPPRAEDVALQILVAEHDVDRLVDLGQDVDRSKRGMPPGIGVERADPDQAMDARLAAEIAVGVFALDVDGRLLDPRRAAVFTVGDLGREPLGLGPHQVHPQEHLGPVAGLGPARAGVDRHEGVAMIVGTAQHRAELERVEIGLRALARRLSDLVVEFVGLRPPRPARSRPRGCRPAGPAPRTA